MKKVILSTSTLLIIAVTLFTCKQQEDKKELKETTTINDGAVAVTLSPVEVVNISIPVMGSGLVATKNETRLAFKIGGLIKKIYVEEGQSVQKGQLLATLDLTEIEAQVNQAKSNVEKWKRDLDRVQRLFKDSAATLEMMQNTQTAYDVAVANETIAEFNREYATIKASSSGKILKKFLSEGELTAPGTPVFYLNSAGQNEWIVKLSLPDVDWARVKQNDKCEIAIDAFPEFPIQGMVSLIGEGADPFTGLYPIEIKISNSNQRLASGLFASVEIIPSKAISLSKIPVEALVEGNGRIAFVFIPNADNKSVKRVLVSVTSIKGSDAFVSKGLESIQSVINSGSGFLTEASIITIQNSKF